MEPLKPKSSKKPTPGLGRDAERRVRSARLALLYERLWPRAWPLIGLVLVFLGAAWFDIWRMVPGYVHGALLLPFLGLGTAALWHLIRGLRWPSRHDALARLEHDSGLAHQPLQALSDSLALGEQDPASLALWRAHLKRAGEALGRLRLTPPHPDVPDADPYALRVIAVVFAVLGLLYAGPDWRARISDALHPDLSFGNAPSALVEAWITPPAYTGVPPIFLTRNAPEKPIVNARAPKGSVMTVRVAGAERAPFIRRHIKSPADAPKDWRANLAMAGDGAKSFKIDVPLGLDETVDVMSGRRKLGHWDITLTPDAPPEIAFKNALSVSEKNLLVIAFKAKDDYRVASAEARIEPVDPAEAGAGVDRDLAPIDASVPFSTPLSLPGGRAKSIDTKQMLDLMAHPWAGLEARVTLAAKDDAGQTGLSAAQTITLPARQFRDPLARAIVEQRRLLALSPRANRERVLRALDALTLAPERFTPDVVVYLGLRSAYHRLANELSKENVKSVHDLFWNLALRIEDGDLTLAEQALRDIQNQLMSALSSDAPDEAIQDLMAQLKSALDRYMRALAEATEKAYARGEMPPAALPDTNVLTSQDFRDLMAAIEQMATTGARGAARDMLAQLQDILNNLQIGDPNARMTESEQAMAGALNGLSDLLESQKQLLDETYRRSGRGTSPRKGDRNTKELARDQAKLREKLEKLQKELGANMPMGLESLMRAGKDMGDAQDALSGGDAADAITPESRALDELQNGMQSLAQSLAQSMGGRMAISGNQGANRDPLGRRRGAMGSISDDGVKVPEELQLQRARQVLEEIQRRASDRRRDQKELDYLDRLLKRFN